MYSTHKYKKEAVYSNMLHNILDNVCLDLFYFLKFTFVCVCVHECHGPCVALRGQNSGVYQCV